MTESPLTDPDPEPGTPVDTGPATDRPAANEPPTAAELGFASNDILVALSHEARVMRALHRWGIELTGEPTRNEALGLAKLTLATEATNDSNGLDAVLKHLYRHFARRYQGWVPTLGKNRLVGRVTGSGELSFGGAGSPQPAAAPAGWPPSRSGAGRGVRVVVLDTAAAADSPLGAGWLNRFSDTFGAQTTTTLVPASGHATFVAGLILSQAPAADVEVRRVLDSAGQATAWDVATAIVDVGLKGADVINLSLVCYTADGKPPLAMAQAISRLNPEIVVVAAAGNHGSVADPGLRRRPAWPAALPSVLAVGAATDEGVVAPFTPDRVPWIDVMTNGVGLVSSYLTGPVTLSEADDSADPVDTPASTDTPASADTCDLRRLRTVERHVLCGSAGDRRDRRRCHPGPNLRPRVARRLPAALAATGRPSATIRLADRGVGADSRLSSTSADRLGPRTRSRPIEKVAPGLRAALMYPAR